MSVDIRVKRIYRHLTATPSFGGQIHCITQYYAQQGIFWKPGKTSKFRPIHSTTIILANFHGHEAKKNIFFRKKNQNGRLKKSSSFKIANSQNFFAKFLRFVLGLVGLNDAKGIDVAQRIWP